MFSLNNNSTYYLLHRHMLMYKSNHVTTSKEWKEILSKAYIFYDSFSVPCRNHGRNVSQASFVERCDMMIILAPGTTHLERMTKNRRQAFVCYRTWRRQALCVLDMFACFYSRQFIQHPILLIRSECGCPKFISPLEVQKLSVGTSRFECCEQNHKDVTCRRNSTRQMLVDMNTEKVRYLFCQLESHTNTRVAH